MRIPTWLRRAGWPLALSASIVAVPALAQDGPPPRDPPGPQDGPAPPEAPHPPGHRREIVVSRAGAPGAQFGIAVAPLPKSLATHLKLKDQGVLIIHVRKDSAAEKAGIHRDDILVTVDDKPVKDPMELVKAVEEEPEKERTLKLLHEGETITVKVTPKKLPDGEGPGFFDKRIQLDGGQIKFDFREVRDIEKTIRDKLHDAGVDLRMQVIEPGAVLPRGVSFGIGRRSELPDDLSIMIRKKGKEPADVEVKKGEQSWSVKEDDLAALPDEVRKDVEGYLGHGPVRFSIVAPGQDGPGPHPPHPAGPPRGPRDEEFGPGGDGSGPDGPRARGPRPPRGPEGPDGPRDPEECGLQGPGGPGGGVERRLEDLTRRMEEMQRQLEGLRRNLGEGDERPRARRPERAEPPEDGAN